MRNANEREYLETGVIPPAGWFHYPIIEGAVERINGYPMYSLGGVLWTVRSHLREGMLFSELIPHLVNAIPQLETVAAGTVVDLPLTLPIVRGILENFRAMTTPEAIQQKANEVVSRNELMGLHYAVQHLSSVLFAELPQADIYYISPKRAYKMSVLLQNAEAVLAPEDALYLSDTARTDLREAGRCLAYDQHTATGFHSLRAVEAVARRYYELVTGNFATDSNGRPLTLYPLIDGLRAKYSTLGNPVDHPLGLIVGDLDRIRVIYRNPIMHPEMTLTANQAGSVFTLSAGVITAMIEDVRASGAHFAVGFSWVVS